MLGRLAASVALMALAACAGMAPAGRTAQRQADVSAPAPVMPADTRELPPPSPHATSPTPQAAPAPALAPPQTEAQAQTPPASAVAAPGVTASPPPPSPPPRDPGDVVVHGSVPEQQVRPPNGDPRSISERREDIRNWDHCVMQVMAQQSDPNQVQTQSPEDVCSRQLGQSSRNAVPQTRLQQPRP
jgi:hypothetical protein